MESVSTRSQAIVAEYENKTGFLHCEKEAILLEVIQRAFQDDVLAELDSKIATSSQEVTDEFGEKKMAVLIEDIEDILDKILP